MNELTTQDYQRIISTLSAQKAQAELAALEWQVRYEAATRTEDTGDPQQVSGDYDA